MTTSKTKIIPIALCRLAIAMVTLACSTATAAESKALPDPFVTTPGEAAYTRVRLDLERGLRSIPAKGNEDESQAVSQVVHLNFRDGALVSAWFQDTPVATMRLAKQAVKLSESEVRGSITYRCSKGPVSGHLRTLAVELALTRQGDRFTGEVHLAFPKVLESKDNPEWSTPVTGRILPPGERIADGAHWSSWLGPHGSMEAGIESTGLVDDLRQARPVWRSEAITAGSYGNGADDRYANKAVQVGNNAGACSPVVADGVLYLGLQVPNPAGGTDPAPNPLVKRWMDETYLAQMAEEGGWLPDEKELIRRHCLPYADDVIVAMDAHTGATRWRCTWPLRTRNHQTHKHRGTWGVPLVTGGRVFYANLYGHLKVMAAEDGSPLWEFPRIDALPSLRHKLRGPRSQSPLVVDNVVVWHYQAHLYGLDAATGTIRWQKKCYDHSRFGGLRKVTLEGREYGLVHHMKGKSTTLILIDPASGRFLWEQPAPGVSITSTAAIRNGIFVSYRYVPKEVLVGERKVNRKYAHLSAWRLSTETLTPMWTDSGVVTENERCELTIGGKVVYGLGRTQIRCVDLETGAFLGEIDSEGFPTEVRRQSNNSMLVVVDGKLVYVPECQHRGGSGYILYDADPSKLTLLGDQIHDWPTLHCRTANYNGQTLRTPIVDGRWFIRGLHGVYCYDLRRDSVPIDRRSDEIELHK